MLRCAVVIRTIMLGVFALDSLAATPGEEFFEQRIRPVLAERCHGCHSVKAERLKAGLRLDSRAGLLAGGETGPAIVPSAPEQSLLIKAISYTDPDLQMPPKNRLSEAVIADFRRWIAEGASWPETRETSSDAVVRGPFDLEARRRQHWAWQPVRPQPVPSVNDSTWPAGPVDHFILARLDRAGLHPAPDADRRTLIRRASFVLTGLPPTPAEVDAFLADRSVEAFARVIDRLLESPHFGEHWGRHWLDKVRYAETLGHEFDYPILAAWRYRDYVVRTFNADVPYDQFAREQIAGDLLESPRRRPDDGANESLLGTTQFWLGQQSHSPVDVRSAQIDVVDNQIDVVSKAFLGLTASCARCHDHKFDAISTRDYYALYGMLASSRYAIRAVDDPGPRREQARALAELRDRIRRALAGALIAREEPTAVKVGPAEFEVERRPGDHALPLAAWFADGEAFADAAAAGQPIVFGSGPRAEVRVIPPGWRHGAALSRRFQGALRSPAFVITNDFLHLRVAGQGSRVNIVLEGFTLIRAPIYGSLRQALRNPAPLWLSVDLSMWRGRRAWIELADFTAADPASELGTDAAQADGWAAIGAAILSPRHEPPALRSDNVTLDFATTLRHWRDAPDQLSAGEVAAVQSWLASVGTEVPSGLRDEREAMEAAICEPVLVAAMAEADGWDEPVFIRGNYKTPGVTAPRKFLTALDGNTSNSAVAAGSGRRELAAAITDCENPLFGRVMVNWVWAHLFGHGLVASVDNFGALGEAPSHPELLDWLADDFRRSGWSVKRLIRQLVLSRAWQMRSAADDPEAEHQDPGNALWHRAHLRRLEAESLRDAILAISGRLDPRVGGPPVATYLTPFMDGRGRPGASGPLDGQGRRSLYLEVRRNFLSPFLLAFDAPAPASTVGWRTVSNVPAQGLAMMNDPFVFQQARYWAEGVGREVNGSPEERIRRLYREALARPPLGDELAAALAFLDSQGGEGPGDRVQATAALCHVLFNLKEFRYFE